MSQRLLAQVKPKAHALAIDNLGCVTPNRRSRIGLDIAGRQPCGGVLAQTRTGMR